MSLLFESEEEDYAIFPQADQNRVRQELSLNAFRGALPPDQYIVRDERIEDAGVDAAVELLLGGAFTNLRAQVQLKSTQTRRNNVDGSVSLSIPVSNLKYMLNGQSPLYVLYIVDRDELRFAWARDERRRISAVNSGWEDQEEITIRFTQQLTSVALSELRQRIEQEGRLQREIYATLSQASVGEKVTICVDSDSLRSSDPQRILSLLLEQGITLVNDGKANEVVEAVGALNPSGAQQARIQLILAYARYLQSQFQDAIAVLIRAILGQDQLSLDDQKFAFYLRDACEYHLGRLSFDEFLERQTQRQERGESVLGIGFCLVELRHGLLLHTEVEARRACVQEILEEVVRVNESPDNSRVLKAQFALFLIYAEGTQLALEEYERWSKIGMRQRMNQTNDLEEAIQQIGEGWQKWEGLAQGTFAVADELKHPLLLADLHLTRGSTALIRLTNAYLIANMFAENEPPIDENRLKFVRDQAEKAKRFYQRTGQLEGELNAQLLDANTYVLEGKTESSRLAATKILPIAQVMQYRSVEAHAAAILAGQTLIDKSRALVKEMQDVDEDERIAAESDEGLRLFASAQLANLELPVERLPHVEQSIFSMRAVSQEHLQWCKHIELIQDLTHTKSPSTMYISDPVQFGECTLIGYRAVVGTQDWKYALEIFKESYCKTCPYRQPKRIQIES